MEQAGKPYEIIDSRGMPGLPTTGLADKMERVLWVPLDASGCPTVTHEMGDVAWSPVTVDRRRIGVALPCMRAVEDARINLGLAHIGMALEFDAEVTAEVDAIARRDLADGNPGMLVQRGVASLGTSVASRLSALLDTEGASVLDLVSTVHIRLERARRRNRSG